MTKIFLSYSRVDDHFVDAMADRLRRIYGHDNVWFDEGLHGGDVWWEEILDQIAACDIFIYVLSNDSVQSEYCQAEFTEARRLQKQIITVQARDRTRLTNELGDIHYINMAHGVGDADALADLIRSVNKGMTKVPNRRPKPRWEPRTPKPALVIEKPRPADATEVDTPTLEVPLAESKYAPTQMSKPFWKKPGFIVSAVLVLGLVTAIASFGPDIISGKDNAEPTVMSTPQTVVAANPTDTLELPTLTVSPTDTPLNATDVEETVQSQMVVIQTEARQLELDAQTATATAASGISQATSEALTRTAAAWTATPSPDTRATAQARLNATATQQFRDMTATATRWTATPTSTFTPTPTNTHTPTPTPTLSPLDIAIRGVERNADWQPLGQEFDGVEMVLVPAGCFEMGSIGRDNDEEPVHEICFDDPFWIDRFEVTNNQFIRFNGQAAASSNWSLLGSPREQITWFEARDFCEVRGARLPSEAEWEYAARGPDELTFPWGNAFVAGNVVYRENSNDTTARVGSRQGGVSWVGAYDLSGNVWEWTSSIYQTYPYDSTDGRESDADTTSSRVLRGGSWNITGSVNVRTSNRLNRYPFNEGFSFGFRCARAYQ